MFYLEASGRGKLFINGKQMLSKYNGHRFKTSCEVVLKEGEEYKLKVDCEELNTQMPIRLTWTPPFKGTDDTPAKLANVRMWLFFLCAMIILPKVATVRI